MAEPTLDERDQDVIERRVQAFRAVLGPLVRAAESTRMATIFTDAHAVGNPLVFANDSFLALTGFASEAVLGRNLAFLLGRVTDCETMASIEATLDAGGDGTWEMQCRRADASEFLAAIYLSPIRDESGVIRLNTLSFVELGGHVDRLLAQRDELHAMYERAPGFIATSSGPEHRFTFANASYERLVGRKGLVGLTVAETLPEIVAQGFIALLDQVFATGEPFVGTNMPITLVDADRNPRQRYIDFVYEPVRDARQRVIGLFCEGYDVTEQKLARDQVQALQSELIHFSSISAMETMATTLAHELNQPLAAIVNYTAGARRLIEIGEASADDLRDVLDAIGESTERAGMIIRHLRKLSSRGQPHRETIDVCDVIRDSLPLVNVEGCEHVDIVECNSAGATVEADPIQIQQVIINLLRNACEATAEAGNRTVRITTSASDTTVTVEVADSGAGVPADMSQSDFRWTPSSKPGGMGVGLSISRTIVDAHGGELKLQSSSGEGSCFAFTLPRFASSPDASKDGAMVSEALPGDQ